MPRSIAPLVLSDEQHRQLEHWLAASGTSQQVALRCRIILALANGKTEVMIAADNRVNRKTVRLWRERFLSQGLQALWEVAPGRGRKATYGTHSTAEVKDWMKRHPRFVVHYVPTSCSWLNLIERWFAELTNKRIRRGSFRSVEELVAAIQEFLAVWNEKPRPFVWNATVDSILAKLARCRQTLEQIQTGCTAPRTRKRKSS